MFIDLEAMNARDSILVIAASALVTHWVFKHREPTVLPILFVLLFLVPAIISPVLVQHHGAISGVAYTFLIYHATLATSIVLYRISPFHPLARYPGPFIARISRSYWTLVALGGQQYLVLQRLHDKYGDVVRIGPNEISSRDVSALQPMMGSQGLPKGPMWEGHELWPPVLPLIGLRDNADHTRRRKPWSRAFSSAALKNYEPLIAKRCSQFIELLVEKKQVDFTHWAHLFTFDFMIDALFGGGSEAMKDDDKDGIVHAILSGFRESQLFEHLPWVGNLARYLPGIGSKVKYFQAVCMKRGAERLEKGSSRKDLFYWLSNEDGSEAESPPPLTVISDSALAIIAGSDTTASTLGNIVYCLLANRDAYKRLQAEVDACYPAGEDSLDPRHLPKMAYLDAVINEAMRLYPVVPSGSQRAPQPHSGDFAAGPHYIPEWTSIRTPFWALQRDPRNFTHPDTFVPDRWLATEDRAGEKMAHNPAAFLPFSIGPRNCVGKNLAVLEMKMLLVHMLQKLELRFKEGFDPAGWERTMQDRYTVVLGELPVVVERRV